MTLKAAPKKVNPLLKPAQKLDERGRFAMTILSRIQTKRVVPDWAIKGAGIRLPKPAGKRRGA